MIIHHAPIMGNIEETEMFNFIQICFCKIIFFLQVFFGTYFCCEYIFKLIMEHLIGTNIFGLSFGSNLQERIYSGIHS